MSVLTFPGQVDLADPAQEPGGCEFGRWQCARPPELVVEVAAIGMTRALCREHAGWMMLAATGPESASRVLVRRLR